jgi:hypothetical protein
MKEQLKNEIGVSPFAETPKVNTVTGNQRIHLAGSIDVSGLSPRARDMSMYILSKLEQGERVVYIDRADYIEYAQVTLQTVTLVIKELIKKNRIAKTCKQGWYWVNPSTINPAL